MAYDINYDDKRFQQVESDKKKAVSDVEKTYSGMINQSDAYYQAQVDATKDWEKKQTEIQNANTQFAIDKIEQEKDQAKKDYTKEQSGAYQDWQKQSDQYGANAEAMAAQGMQNTGYSESSQVSMYNTYQNRVATARETFNQIVMDFNNQMTEARLQNNAALAEIAFKAQEKRLELNLQKFQYKNQLIIEQSNKKLEVENQYYNRWQDVLAQINHENALAEQIRQYNTTLAEQKRQHAEEMSFKKQQLAEEQRQFNASLSAAKSSSSSGGNSGGTTKKSSGSSGGTIKKSSGSSGSSSRSSISKGSSGSSSSGSSSSGSMPSATKKSILNLGQGPISAKNLAKQVASGKVRETKDKKGNTTFKYNGLYRRF